jgi:hypothetical protein
MREPHKILRQGPRYHSSMKAKTQDAKKQPEYIEGQKAFQRFDATMTALLSVPKAVVEKREKAYRAQVDANPNRRGPKRKA